MQREALKSAEYKILVDGNSIYCPPSITIEKIRRSQAHKRYVLKTKIKDSDNNSFKTSWVAVSKTYAPISALSEASLIKSMLDLKSSDDPLENNLDTI
jgi:hypothetical protein